MNIDIRTEVLPESYRWDPKNPVTGTTKFYVRVAEELAALGHKPFVFYDGPAMIHRGVSYLPRDRGSTNPDLLLDCNYQGPRDHAERAFQWTSFFNRPDTCVGEGYDRLFLVSDYVWSTLERFTKAPVSVLELGCDMPVVAQPRLLEREKFCAYTSSPDRGGNFLNEIWGEVQAATGYQLLVTPYDAMATEKQVQDILDASRFWLYPATGTDSIISTLEAQARGCIPFYVPHMALPHTVRYGIETDLHRFKADLISMLNAPTAFGQWEQTRAASLDARPIPTWRNVAEGILAHA
jgi:hypothetical protein